MSYSHTKRRKTIARLKRRWPITLWFVNCPGTEWKARKRDVIALIRDGLFPELEEQFPELAHHSKYSTKPSPG